MENAPIFFSYMKGVRQGCPLSPLLFNLLINGVVKILRKIIQLGDNNISCLSCADDLFIFSSSKDGLKNSINATSDFLSKWNREVNCNQTRCMTFNKSGRLDKHVFTVNNRFIDNMKSYKYPGITISKKNYSLNKTLNNNLAVKTNRALFSLKTNLNLLKMPIKLY